MENDNRTQKIVSDVIGDIRESRHQIVLTERREYAETINELLKECGVNYVILKGAMDAAERKHVEEHLHSA